MPGVGQSYNENGSSYAARLATQWKQRTGRDADANDPNFAAWVKEALPAMVAQDHGDYERSKARWRVADRIAMVGVLGVMGAGVGSALAGGGTAAAGASGTGAGGGALPPIAGGAPWAVTPYATTATMAGTGAGAGIGAGAGAAGGMGAGGGVGGSILGGMSARDLAGLGLALGGTVGGAMANRNQPNMAPNTFTTDPNLQRLMQTQQGRLDKSEPLYDSIMAMANGLLPREYQKGGGGMT